MKQTVDPAGDAMSAGSSRKRVSGIDRAVQILDHLYERGEPDGAYAIAKAIGAPLSTVYSIAEDLVAKDLLQRLKDGGLWLGVRLYHLGLAYGRSLEFLEVARREADELCDRLHQTVQICGRDGDNMLVMAMSDRPDHYRFTSRVGTRMPLNWTASGRLLVGHLPESERIALFRRAARKSPTGRAPVDPKELSDAAAKALAERLSIQVSESDFAVACIASPVLDAAGDCVATISIVLPESAANEDTGRLGAAVRAAAARIEETMGWRVQGPVTP